MIEKSKDAKISQNKNYTFWQIMPKDLIYINLLILTLVKITEI